MQINKSGLWGEIFAARYLRDNGYKIISSNYRTRMGEIDIVASKGRYICFVEVKTRNEKALYQPKEAVDSHKQSRIIAASKSFVKSFETQKQPRFDVCEVFLDEKYKLLKINYIENSFNT